LNGVADARGGLHIVHGVKEDAAHIVVDQVHNLLGGVKDAGVEQRFGVIAVAAEEARELSRHAGATERHGALNLVQVSDGHDACFDGHINPGTLGFLTEGIKLIVIEKQLGDQVINPAIDLDFQVFDILIE